MIVMKVPERRNSQGSIHLLVSKKYALDNFYPRIDKGGKSVVGNRVVKMITVFSLGRKSEQIPFVLGECNACIELPIPELTD